MLCARAGVLCHRQCQCLMSEAVSGACASVGAYVRGSVSVSVDVRCQRQRQCMALVSVSYVSDKAVHQRRCLM